MEDVPVRRRWAWERAAQAWEGLSRANRSVAVLTDGPGTVLTLLERRHGIMAGSASVQELQEAVLQTWHAFVQRADETGLPLSTGDLGRDLDLLRRARHVVWTEGVFARKVNQYLRREPAPITHLNEFSWQDVVAAGVAVAQSESS